MIALSIISTLIILFLYLFIIFRYKDFVLQVSTTIGIIILSTLFIFNVTLLTGSDKPMSWYNLEALIYERPAKMEVLSDYSKDGILHIWLLNSDTNKPIYISLPDPNKKKNKKLQREKSRAKKTGRKVYFHFESKKQKQENQNQPANKKENGNNEHDGSGSDMGNFEADILGEPIRKSPYVIENNNDTEYRPPGFLNNDL